MTALARLVEDVGGFVSQVWDRRPLLREREEGAEGFGDLVDVVDIDRILASAPLRRPWVSLARDGRAVDPREFTEGVEPVAGAAADRHKVLHQLASGATVMLYRVNEWWLPVGRYCRALERELHHPATASLIITPGGTRGLDCHREMHDAFCIQLLGEQACQVFPRPPGTVETALEPPDDRATPLLAAGLGEGDVLYVPRGFPHLFRSGESTSVHLSVLVHPVTYRQLAADVFDGLLSAPAFDEALPIGFLQDPGSAVEALRHRLDELRGVMATVPDDLLARAVARQAVPASSLDGAFLRFLDSERLGPDALVRLRPGCTLEVVGEKDGDLRLRVVGTELDVPATWKPVIERLATGSPVCALDFHVSGEVADPVSLLRRLVRAGLTVNSEE